MNETFAERLAHLRAEKGLTQRELGAAAGVAWSMISKYESGKSAPRLKVLMKLADALGVSADELKGALSKQTNKLKIYDGFSSRLIAARANAAFSRKKLCEATGLSGDDLADMELGDLLPSPEDVKKIAHALGTSVDSLAGAKHEEEAVLLHFVEPGDNSVGTRENLAPVPPDTYRRFAAFADELGITPGELMSAIVFREAAAIDANPDDVPSLEEFVQKVKSERT
ncbi:helix-turn-helix domain-containing protein [Pseudomonas ficuserectae]|uniref:AraC family transcriptional regulator n=2 Tax=Pseudomonas amygdali pv. lachrymans TaxID=53707 RepID=A0AB37RAF4_PSEAV|nr:helix-turn-helix transcriptional regulator [Pseudomonas amygdali]ARA80851.1 transcriptional regulator [Pseudomonas amygdali pv. lachrymans]AXH56344.1 transcriptional regulator [Pseudomonas amygdali pv. lachrymans str. M301315]PWD04046.1 transcriptional regulator [Pseudomonas amygdali pv. lachrymans]QWA52601.1 helix-turn-helix domain-containing protein [Pseudomonas amygdali pv. lachrymans]RMM48558.1 AraC family transcriptional regulator [Pseudomonas amygdali pv. lachrymans]